MARHQWQSVDGSGEDDRTVDAADVRNAAHRCHDRRSEGVHGAVHRAPQPEDRARRRTDRIHLWRKRAFDGAHGWKVVFVAGVTDELMNGRYVSFGGLDMRRFTSILCAAAMVVLSSGTAFAGDGEEGVSQFRPRAVSDPLPRFAVGVKVGTLGIGFQVGTALASRINLRGGANFFNYNDTLTQDGVAYNGSLQLRSVEAKVDLFVIGGFRVTPGLLLYNDNNVTATASVPNGTSVSFGGTRYFSNPADPLRGTASVGFNKFAPSLGIGFGNLLPRSARHWSLSTDL